MGTPGGITVADVAWESGNQPGQPAQFAGEVRRHSLVRQTGAVEANDRRILDLNVDGRSFVDVMGEVAEVLVVREQNLQAAEILFNEWLVRVSVTLETLATQVRAAAAAD